MAEWISLLRAINLGSHNRVPMPALREALTAAGFTDVRTHVQSGNIVAGSRHRAERGVAEAVRAVVRKHFDVDTPVIVRGKADWLAAIAANPFPVEAAKDPKLVHLVFLDGVPSAGGVRALEAVDFGADRLRVVGREVFLSYAQSSQNTRMTPAVLGRHLTVDGTARNWRSVLAIGELLA